MNIPNPPHESPLPANSPSIAQLHQLPELADGAPLHGEEATGNLPGNIQGVNFRALFREPLPPEEPISDCEYAAELVGNPVRTLGSLIEFAYFQHSASLATYRTLARRELTSIRNYLSNFQRHLESIAEMLEAAPPNIQALPEYARCSEDMTRTIESLNTTLEILNDDSRPLSDYERSFNQLRNNHTRLSSSITAFNQALQNIHNTPSLPLSPPGAVAISAEEAAAQGIFQAREAQQRIIEPEAIPIPVTVPLSDKIAGESDTNSSQP